MFYVWFCFSLRSFVWVCLYLRFLSILLLFAGLLPFVYWFCLILPVVWLLVWFDLLAWWIYCYFASSSVCLVWVLAYAFLRAESVWVFLIALWLVVHFCVVCCMLVCLDGFGVCVRCGLISRC